MNPAATLAAVGGSLTQGGLTALLAVALFAGGYLQGAAGVHAEWEAETARRTARATEAKAAQAEATAQVVTEYVDRIQVVREKGRTIVKKVPVYVPSDTCPLPGGFRLLHDAAARGEPADPAGIPDAPPVTPQDAAAAIADNYTACRLNAEQMTALQAWVQKVTATAQ